MQYDYLFCATCGVRRMGHGHLCTVCGGLLRRPASRHQTADVASLPSLVRVAPTPAPASRPAPTRQPVAA